MSAQLPNPPPSGDSQNWPSAPTYGQPQSRDAEWDRGEASANGSPQRPLPAPGKNYALAWALSLFLGMWGADRFYLGRWKTGLLKFFTFGGLFIWYFIDLILLVTGVTKDAKGRPLQQFETIKWPSRIISGVVVAGFFAMFALAGAVEPPPSETEVAAVVEDDAQAPAEDEAAPTTTPAPTVVPTTPAPTTVAPAPTPETVTAAPGTALAVLATLEVKDRGSKTGYDRDSFGWRDDLDRNGCDTRNDILRRDLREITLKGDSNGCVVLLGTLDSPYSGDTVPFDRANNTIDIDHVVALSDAWQTGASGWSDDVKREFANDPLNLLAVESSLNQQKGAGDAATWLPPKKDYRCEYVSRQIAVKDKYDLWIKPAEGDAMEGVLEDCEGFLAIEDDHDWPAIGGGDVVATQSEPTPTPAPAPAPTTAPAPAPKPAPAPAPKPAPTQAPAPKPAPAPAPKKDPAPAPAKDDGGSVHYKNCDAARAAGAAPVYKGDPGYRKGLDRDGDGVGCE